MTQPIIPLVAKHLGRPTTAAAARRAANRMSSNVNAPKGESDVINQTSSQAYVQLYFGGSHLAEPNLIAWNQIIADPSGWYNVGTSQIIVPTAGLYLAILQTITTGFTVGLGTNNVMSRVVVNSMSTGFQGSRIDTTPTGGNLTQSVSVILSLAANDAVSGQIMGYPNHDLVFTYTQASLGLAMLG